MPFKLILSGLQKILNHYLQLDPLSGRLLNDLSGKILLVYFYEIPCYWIFSPEKIELKTEFSVPPHVTLKGNFFDYFKLGFSDKPGAQSGLKIEGDAAVALRLKELFTELDIDWEEQLSRFTGDFVAYYVAKCFRDFQQWTKRSAQTLQLNVTDYLQEELSLLPTPVETELFYQQVENLRDDIERFSQHFQIVQKRG